MTFPTHLLWVLCLQWNLPCAIHSCHIRAKRLTWICSLQIILRQNNTHKFMNQPHYLRKGLLNFVCLVHKWTVEGASDQAWICVDNCKYLSVLLFMLNKLTTDYRHSLPGVKSLAKKLRESYILPKPYEHPAILRSIWPLTILRCKVCPRSWRKEK